MKSNLKWIIFFSLICALCLAVWLYRADSTEEYSRAEITLDGKVIRAVDLSVLSVPYEFEVRTPEGGYNKITAEKGKIAVTDADCPDKICVKQGYISNGAAPIVCLPHRLSVTITDSNENDIDAVAGKIGGEN